MSNKLTEEECKNILEILDVKCSSKNYADCPKFPYFKKLLRSLIEDHFENSKLKVDDKQENGFGSLKKDDCVKSYRHLVNEAYSRFYYRRGKHTKPHCLEFMKPMFRNDCRSLKVYKKMIEEYFDNHPLKLEELKEGQVYWDNYEKEWCKLIILCGMNPHMQYFDGTIDDSLFKGNRFYRKQVEE